MKKFKLALLDEDDVIIDKWSVVSSAQYADEPTAKNRKDLLAEIYYIAAESGDEGALETLIAVAIDSYIEK